jgi:prevent-host-death family protein
MPRPPRAAPAVHVDEDIVPIAELKAHLSEMVRELPARRRPVVVTQNGRPAAVILSPAAFDRLSYRARFVAAVEEGLEDIDEGRVLSDSAVGGILDERFGARAKAKTKRR